MKANKQRYKIGVMKTPIEARDLSDFNEIVAAAVEEFENTLGDDLDLDVAVFEFSGPHLTPAAGAYSPLDFLQLGISEKLEREVHFLLLVTEVDLSATVLSYVLALPSALTNVGVLSTKRLSPSFWGKPEDPQITQDRLVALLLHTTGHLLSLEHDAEPGNVMHDFRSVTDLDAMRKLTSQQTEKIKRNLPIEAREEVAQRGFWGFTVKQIFKNWKSVWNATRRANPLHLVTQLPTMITAALSVVVILFFTAEIWDVASTVELYQLLIFSFVSLVAATLALYRAFAFGAVLKRNKAIAESTVVTSAATLLSLFLTMLVLYLAFFLMMYLATLTIFPRRLMATWPTVDPATKVLDQVKLNIFLAAMGVLAGSLGGRADSRDVVRQILFIDEES